MPRRCSWISTKRTITSNIKPCNIKKKYQFYYSKVQTALEKYIQAFLFYCKSEQYMHEISFKIC